MERSMNEADAGAGRIPDVRELAKDYLAFLLSSNRVKACALITSAASCGVPVKDIYLNILAPVQHEIGRLWQANQVSVALEHFCTAVTQLVMSQLFPLVITEEKNGLSMVGCCVGHELHEVGIRMVSDFFEMEGFSTFYMGANCSTKSVAEAVADRKADLLCLSVTMYQNLNQAQDTIALMRKTFPHLRLMLGGFPFLNSPDLATRLGADGYAKDAQAAVELGYRLCLERKT